MQVSMSEGGGVGGSAVFTADESLLCMTLLHLPERH